MKIKINKCSGDLWYKNYEFPIYTDVIEATAKNSSDIMTKAFGNKDYYYSEEYSAYILKADTICNEKFMSTYSDQKLTNAHYDIFNEQKDFETKKFDDNKPSFSNIPQKALWELMKVFKVGESKYGKYNHSLGCEHTRLADGAVRHISQYLMSEDTDEETKTHHLANAAANCLMLLDQIMNGTGTDNRNTNYKKQK